MADHCVGYVTTRSGTRFSNFQWENRLYRTTRTRVDIQALFRFLVQT